MDIQPSQEKERPDWVWFLLIFYGIGILISFAIILFMMLSSKNGQLDVVGIGIALVVMALRGVGLVRLYYFKSDAWLYLSLALFIIVGDAAFDFIFGGTDFFFQKHSISRMIGGIATGLAVIIYAYNLGQKEKLPGA
jgi:hypothetical protein